MEQNKEYIDDLIIQLLSDELDNVSLKELQAWIAASPENETYFRQKQEIWFSAIETPCLEKYNKAEAFKLFQQRVSGKKFRLHHILQNWKKYAAVILLLVTVGCLSYFQGQNGIKETFANVSIEAPYGSRTKTTLPDGTIVWLNSGSKLTYTQGYGVSDRTVDLNGEGYFEVTKNEKLPFTVSSHSLKVNVLGTKFTFCDYAEDTTAEVVLKQGCVQLNSLLSQEEAITMTPGQQVTLNKRTGKTKTEEADIATATSWIEGELIFEGASLADIAKQIKRKYNIEVIIEKKALHNYQFYGEFGKYEQSLTEVLETLTATGRFHYKIKNNTVIIY